MNQPTLQDQANRIAAFRYSHQFRLCRQDGTAKTMTPELLATLPESERKRHGDIWGFQQSRPELYGKSGPLFCGKKAGICGSQHCREIHCS